MAPVKHEVSKANGIEDKILDAAMQVVSTKTISGTRMQLIADAAGIPKANLHYYFKTKQNLMLALHRRAVTHFIDVRRENRPKCRDELREHLQVFFNQKLDCILKEPELISWRSISGRRRKFSRNIKKSCGTPLPSGVRKSRTSCSDIRRICRSKETAASLCSHIAPGGSDAAVSSGQPEI
jgi:AcrR family transcriptional regulator